MNYGLAKRWSVTDNMSVLKNARVVSCLLSAEGVRLWPTVIIGRFILLILNVGKNYESSGFITAVWAGRDGGK